MSNPTALSLRNGAGKALYGCMQQSNDFAIVMEGVHQQDGCVSASVVEYTKHETLVAWCQDAGTKRRFEVQVRPRDKEDPTRSWNLARALTNNTLGTQIDPGAARNFDSFFANGINYFGAIKDVEVRVYPDCATKAGDLLNSIKNDNMNSKIDYRLHDLSLSKMFAGTCLQSSANLCISPTLTNVMYTTAPDGGLEPRIDLASARRGSMKPGTVERTILATTNKEIKDQSCFLVTSQLGVKSNVKGLGRKGSDAAYTTAPQDPLAESGFDYVTGLYQLTTGTHMFSENPVLVSFTNQPAWSGLHLSYNIDSLPSGEVTDSNRRAARWIELGLVRGFDLAEQDFLCWLSEEGVRREESQKPKYTEKEMDDFYKVSFIEFVEGVLSTESLGYELKPEIKARLMGIITDPISFTPLLDKMLEYYKSKADPANSDIWEDTFQIYRPIHCTIRVKLIRLIILLPYGCVRETSISIPGVVGRALAEMRTGTASTAMELDLFGAGEVVGYNMQGLGTRMVEAVGKALQAEEGVPSIDGVQACMTEVPASARYTIDLQASICYGITYLSVKDGKYNPREKRMLLNHLNKVARHHGDTSNLQTTLVETNNAVQNVVQRKRQLAAQSSPYARPTRKQKTAAPRVKVDVAPVPLPRQGNLILVSESAWASRINFLEDLDEDEAMEEDEQEEDPMPPTNGNVQALAPPPQQQQPAMAPSSAAAASASLPVSLSTAACGSTFSAQPRIIGSIIMGGSSSIFTSASAAPMPCVIPGPMFNIEPASFRADTSSSGSLAHLTLCSSTSTTTTTTTPSASTELPGLPSAAGWGSDNSSAPLPPPLQQPFTDQSGAAAAAAAEAEAAGSSSSSSRRLVSSLTARFGGAGGTGAPAGVSPHRMARGLYMNTALPVTKVATYSMNDSTAVGSLGIPFQGLPKLSTGTNTPGTPGSPAAGSGKASPFGKSSAQGQNVREKQALFLENVMHGMCTSYVSPALPTMNVGLSVSDRRQALLGGETGTAETAAAGSPTQRDSPARIKVQQAKQRFEQLAAPLVWPHRKHSDDNEAADQQDGMEMDG